jgi:NAD(P)-dependent dehydrogenase (short-subunit alcohol dehydrogenase family)
MAQPDDVAALVCFLSSEEAKNITGALISTDGGYVAR